MLQGSLFPRAFLEEGITETKVWLSLPAEELATFEAESRRFYDAFPVTETPNEATTEEDLIFPLIRALGWTDYLPQQTASRRGRADVPDALLFADETAKAAANAEQLPANRYHHGIAIAENKPWQEPLDRAGKERDGRDRVPSTQMLRYMSRVEVQSDRRIQWGILTNGRHWRLYYQGARSRSEEFLELDLPVLLGLDAFADDLFAPPSEERPHWLKVFYLMFRRQAFVPDPADGRTFHRCALDEGRDWEARVAADMSAVVFEQVYPDLVQGLAAADPEKPQVLTAEYLEELRHAALTLLYRLLFILYAEDRNLLPARESRYDDYGLKIPVRQSVADRIDIEDTFSATAGNYYSHTRELFRLIGEGDESIGLPAYNGGLFDPARAPLLERATLPDAVFAPLLDGLSRREENSERKWINFRNMSVQQLGSIYERLLEFEPVAGEDGRIRIKPNAFARKISGSYYTHEDLVRLIIERTVGPLLDERSAEFEAKARELKRSRHPKKERLRELRKLDPATRFLDLKVCDPAMGSGHFLVSLVDYLADRVLEAVAEAEETVGWADEDAPYVSPLVGRSADIRTRILEQASAHGWLVKEEQLDDRQIIRRMILKRVIYGVDKNPMAVELAKVSLWLHTFTVGAPLSFLDHHLRVGDSLFGEWVRAVEDQLHERGAVFIHKAVAQAKNAAAGMARVEEITDADIAEVEESAANFAGVAQDTLPLSRFLDFLHALRWLDRHDEGNVGAVHAFIDGQFGNPIRISAGLEKARAPGAPEPKRLFEDSLPEQKEMLPKAREKDIRAFNAFEPLLAKAIAMADEERFFHWEVAFPGVWRNWESTEPEGGFDAVIGNPPWDRIKLQEVEWFAARRPEIAHAQRAADRKRMIRELEKRRDPLWQEYVKARDHAEAAAQVARTSRQYPLLSRGDVNSYALFVERALRLVKPEGLIGLLVPSGIASDKTASAFFGTIAKGGRLAALLDFENKRVFFPDVDSRFKFCVFVAGGKNRRFDQSDCVFFLHDVTELNDPNRVFALTPEDFANVNPNTGTAPIFRTTRDKGITTAIYRRVPVLVDRRSDPPKTVWPVRYVRMFDMTNDSHLFKTRDELLADGFYPVAGNRLKKGSLEYVPLYEGKMVQAFDHRAASIVVNPDNVHRPAQPEPATLEQHKDRKWRPTPQFWVAEQIVEWSKGLAWVIGFKHITAPTNVRTIIAAALPFSGFGNSVPIFFPELPDRLSPGASEEERTEWRAEVEKRVTRYKACAPLLLGNANSFALDYVVRQKVHGQNLNLFVIEQLPVVPEHCYQKKIGPKMATEIVREEVIKLTYTAHDMKPFAQDMGYDGPPFVWDEEERRHSRARLDALYFLLYEIDRDDAAYILDTFPIVREQDEKAFAGCYVTKELILGYMAAFEAGDTTSRVAL